jgi:hypothetical protein
MDNISKHTSPKELDKALAMIDRAFCLITPSVMAAALRKRADELDHETDITVLAVENYDEHIKLMTTSDGVQHLVPTMLYDRLGFSHDTEALNISYPFIDDEHCNAVRFKFEEEGEASFMREV